MSPLCKNKKILILDDDEALCRSTRQLLEEEAYVVVTHGSTQGIAEVLANERPNLVLMDVDMPGVTREMVVAMLRADPGLRNVPVVLHAIDDPQKLRMAARRTTVACIPKGNRFELRARVATYLRLAAARY